MAHGLRLRVVAEGVENEGQFDFLRALGNDEYQGFLYSKPLPAREVERRLLLELNADFRTTAGETLQ